MLTVNETELQAHQLKGPVGYTIVGSPTIVDGVASGFSTSNGLICYSSIASTGNIEFNAKINVQDFSSANPIFKAAEQYEQLVVRTTGQIACSFGLFDGEWRAVASTYRISANTTYIVNVKLQDNTCHIKIYDANNQLLADEQQSFTYQYKATSYMEIGRGPDNTYFKGSIDLNHTYIKVNGKLWFYQPAPTKYIVKDGKLVWADPNLYLEGTGTQYIQTNYTPVQYDAIETEFKTGTALSAVYSAGTDNYQLVVLPSFGENTVYAKYFRTGGAISFSGSYSSSNWYKIKMDGNGTTTIGDVSKSDEYQSALDGSNTTLRLFRRRNGSNRFSGAMKSFKITNNGVPKLYLVPVPTGLQIGNFTVPSNGMFDIVNQQFYANAGTGTFTIGRDE